MTRRSVTLASVGVATLLATLPACGSGGSNDDSSPSGSAPGGSSAVKTVSVSKALSSDAAATQACQDLLGPKGQKLIDWHRGAGTATEMEATRDTSIGEVSCEVTDSGTNKRDLKIFNSTGRGHHELSDSEQDVYLAKDDQNVSYGVGGISSEDDMRNLGIELQSQVGTRLVK